MVPESDGLYGVVVGAQCSIGKSENHERADVSRLNSTNCFDTQNSQLRTVWVLSS